MVLQGIDRIVRSSYQLLQSAAEKNSAFLRLFCREAIVILQVCPRVWKKIPLYILDEFSYWQTLAQCFEENRALKRNSLVSSMLCRESHRWKWNQWCKIDIGQPSTGWGDECVYPINLSKTQGHLRFLLKTIPLEKGSHTRNWKAWV